MKRIYLLIGPKGSGKTFVGQLLEQQFAIPFLPVETIALQVKGNRSFDNSDYIEAVFQAIEEAVRQQMNTTDELIFESTGLTGAFEVMLKRLRTDFEVVLIKVEADPETCLSRIRARNQSLHVPVPEEHIRRMNLEVVKKRRHFDAVINNNNAAPEAICRTFERIRKGAS